MGLARRGTAFFLAMVLTTWFAASAPSRAQQAEPPAPPPDLATLAQDILTRLTEAEKVAFSDVLGALPSIEESKQAGARDALVAMSSDLKVIATILAKINDLDQRVANAPLLLEQIRTELAQPPPAIEMPPDQTVPQLEQGLGRADAELTAARQDAASLDAEARQRSILKDEIPTVIARTRQEIQTLDDEIASRAALGAADLLARAELLRLSVHRRMLEQTIASLEKEQQSIEARQETLRARQDRSARRVSQAEKQVDVWRRALNEAREAEAKRVAAEAKKALRQSANEHKVIQKLLQDRTELASEHQKLVAQHQQAQNDRQALQARVRSVRADFVRSFEEIELAGLSNAVGIILGLRRSELPNVRTHEQQMRRRQQQLSEALGKQFEFERRRDELTDVAAAVEKRMTEIESTIPAEERDAIRDRAAEEIREVAGLLSQIITTSRAVSEELSQADGAERALAKVTREYAAFIDEHILWVRSASPLSWDDLKSAGESLTRIAQRPLWQETLTAFRQGVRRDPIPYLVLLVPVAAWVLLVLSSRRIARARELLGEELNRDRLRPSFRPTLRAILLVLVSSLRWPLLLLVVAQILAAIPDAPAAIQSLVDALRSASFIWLALEVGRQACASGGFAEVHLRWPRDAVATVRRNLFWLTCLVVPMDVLFRLAISEGHELSSEPVARLTFIAGMLVLAAFIQRTLRPHGPILRAYFDPIKGGWLARLSGVWFLVLVCLPLFLAVLAGLGYFYSAQRLQRGLSATLLLGLVTVILSALFHRWLWVTRRRVAIDQALKRRAALQSQSEGGESAAADVAAAISEEEIDLPAANAQTLQLFRSAAVLATLIALWAIWNGVLPALGLLDQFELWPHFGPVEVTTERPESISDSQDPAAAPTSTSAGNGAAAPSNGTATGDASRLIVPRPAAPASGSDSGNAEAADAVDRVTIADLAMAIIIGITTLILTRNIPGLLEIAILQRLPLDAGSRYAISTIVRYVIVIVGVMVTFGAVGIGWSRIQWLAAALTFGLAFGLQEIFANFISGLIILIERPMRVGDTVTVGGISGEVSRIRMRATTITDWNRKELIVPNKEFITGQLVNWTLSDPTLRIEVPIGVAYGSDTRLVRSLLLKVANKCEFVLKDPPARAVFLGFGDNALNFELRIFISNIRDFVDARDYVNYGIDDEFRKAGIEISFPQRDIHIRTIDGVLPIRQIDAAAPGSQETR